MQKFFIFDYHLSKKKLKIYIIWKIHFINQRNTFLIASEIFNIMTNLFYESIKKV